MASFLGNMDSLNLLLEYGADLSKKHNLKMDCFDEIIRSDNHELFECVYPLTKNITRNLKEVSLTLSFR